MFSTESIGLTIVLVVGLATGSGLVATAAAVLLAIRFTRITRLLPLLERRGVEMGLLFLTLAMLVPFALGQVSLRDINKSFVTVPGILALIGGTWATHLNGRGLKMLNEQSHLMISLIVGSIVGIIVWGGTPVGPLMAAGVTYLMMQMVAPFQYVLTVMRRSMRGK